MRLFTGPSPSLDYNLFEGRECVFCSPLKSQDLAKENHKFWLHKQLSERNQKLKENGDKDNKGGERIKKENFVQIITDTSIWN